MLQRKSIFTVSALLALLAVTPRAVVSFNTPMQGSQRFNSQLRAKITAEQVLENPQWPDKWPFKPNDFSRQDESVDTEFYDQARLVYHIDEGAIDALTKYYSTVFTDDISVLDICSSWVSHYPKDLKFKQAAGLGMNKYELEQNKQLTEFAVKDLNIDPIFPHKDNTFDFVTCVVSVDYLTRPLEVFSEIKRVLKPGGKAIISQSNRCFPTKAINIWLNTNDFEHIFIIGAYFHYATGFEKPESLDISPSKGGTLVNMFGGGGDPMYIIQAAKA